MAIEDGQDKGFDSPATGQDMSGIRRDHRIDQLGTSSFRNTPRTNGKWATGARRRIATAMMHLLEWVGKSTHHNGTETAEIEH